MRFFIFLTLVFINSAFANNYLDRCRSISSLSDRVACFDKARPPKNNGGSDNQVKKNSPNFSISADRANGYEWRNASALTKIRITSAVVNKMNAGYALDEMLSCVDEFYSPPASQEILKTSLVYAFNGCHMMLKR